MKTCSDVFNVKVVSDDGELIVMAVACSSADQMVSDFVWHGNTSTISCCIPVIEVPYNSTHGGKVVVNDISFTAFIF